MVDYTWIANLLRETQDFAAKNEFTTLSENIAVACAALLSDTEGRAEISVDARQWLESVSTRATISQEN